MGSAQTWPWRPRRLWREGAAETTKLPGVRPRTERWEGQSVTRVEILDPRGAEASGQARGHVPDPGPHRLLAAEEGFFPGRWRAWASSCGTFCRRRFVLVVGLGNAAMTADAVGPETLRNLLITRHLMASLPGSSPASGRSRPLPPGPGDTGWSRRRRSPPWSGSCGRTASSRWTPWRPGNRAGSAPPSSSRIPASPRLRRGEPPRGPDEGEPGGACLRPGGPRWWTPGRWRRTFWRAPGVPDWQGLLKEKQRGMTVTPGHRPPGPGAGPGRLGCSHLGPPGPGPGRHHLPAGVRAPPRRCERKAEGRLSLCLLVCRFAAMLIPAVPPRRKGTLSGPDRFPSQRRGFRFSPTAP